MPEHFFCEVCTLERANPFWRNSSSDRRMLVPPAVLQAQQLSVSPLVLPWLRCQGLAAGLHAAGL